MVYAQLQLGRDQAARSAREFKSAGGAGCRSLRRPVCRVGDAGAPGARARRLGRGTQLPVQGTAFPHAEAITTFARALGAARKGDVAPPRQDAARLEALHRRCSPPTTGYWATEVEVQRIAVAAWIAQAQGPEREALRLMRGAADVEDQQREAHRHPGRVAPARELLGEMLLAQKQYAAALKEFRAVAGARAEPAARLRRRGGAAEAAGDRAKARSTTPPCVELTATPTRRCRDRAREDLPRARGDQPSRGRPARRAPRSISAVSTVLLVARDLAVAEVEDERVVVVVALACPREVPAACLHDDDVAPSMTRSSVGVARRGSAAEDSSMIACLRGIPLTSRSDGRQHVVGTPP
jgi:hypothetical protein